MQKKRWFSKCAHYCDHKIAKENEVKTIPAQREEQDMHTLCIWQLQDSNIHGNHRSFDYTTHTHTHTQIKNSRRKAGYWAAVKPGLFFLANNGLCSWAWTTQHLTSEIPNSHIALAESEEQLVLVKEDEGWGGHEVCAGHFDPVASSHLRTCKLVSKSCLYCSREAA